MAKAVVLARRALTDAKRRGKTDLSELEAHLAQVEQTYSDWCKLSGVGRAYIPRSGYAERDDTGGGLYG